jgi:hypothetical protein
MKKGQVTIFIVLGILLVGAIAFFFIIRQGYLPNIGGSKEINPNSFLESCIEDKILESVGILSMQGGKINPELFQTFKFDEDTKPWNITYLCYNQNSYDRCINQEPMLINGIENEIENYIKSDVKICFDELEKNLKKQNYEVSAKYNGFDINLNQRGITLLIDGEINLIKNGENSKMQNIGAIVQSNLYNLLLVAHEILNSESQYCDFNKESYMMIYPEIKIELFSNSDGEKIYSIMEREIENIFRFAVRGCVIE